MTTVVFPFNSPLAFLETQALDSLFSAGARSASSVSQQLLPTDPIGAFALTLTNVVVGSVVQVEDQAGTTTLHNSTAATGTVLINLSAYSGGNPLNDLRIKVRKGSASPFYRPFETLTTAVIGSQSIYVAQIPDE